MVVRPITNAHTFRDLLQRSSASGEGSAALSVASIPDLIVAATARARSLEILRYDRDFDTVARFTEQPARWIVPPGVRSDPAAFGQRHNLAQDGQREASR